MTDTTLPEGIDSAAADRHSEIAHQASAGDAALKRINEIDVELKRLEAVENPVIARADGEVKFKSSVSDEALRLFIKANLGQERRETVAEFNAQFGA